MFLVSGLGKGTTPNRDTADAFGSRKAVSCSVLLSEVGNCYFKKVTGILKLNRNEFRYNFFVVVSFWRGHRMLFKKYRF